MRVIALILFSLATVLSCARPKTPTASSVPTDEVLQAIVATDLFKTNPALAMAQMFDSPAGKRLLSDIEQMQKQHEKQLDRFRTQIDHVAVLAACRSVMRRRLEYPRDPKWHGGEPTKQNVSLINPADEHLPAALREIGATSLIVQDDMMIIEMGGGGRHYGMIAYAANIDDSANNRINEKLIDGLWLYSE